MHAPLNKSSFLKSTSGKAVRRLREAQKLSRANEADVATVDDDEKCPVIRAHQIFITSGTAGRLRVVFF